MITTINLRKFKFSVCCSWIIISSFFLKKDGNVVTEIFFASLEFTNFDFLLCWGYITQEIFHAIFCLISKIFTLGEVLFNYSFHRSILVRVNNSKQTRQILSIPDKYKVVLFQASIKSSLIFSEQTKRSIKSNLQRQLC